MKILKTVGFVALAASLLTCQTRKPVDKMNEAELKSYASDLAERFLIVDGHVDFPYRLNDVKPNPRSKFPDILLHASDGDFDYDRAKEGGMDAPFMSIYIPSSYQLKPDFGKSFADTLIDLVGDISRTLPEQFAPAKSPEEVRKNTAAGLISLPMGMENGAPIGMDLKNVKYFFDRGIRYITLTHGKYNQICGSSGDTTTNHQGLTSFGREVVTEMNRTGIMVDISHVDDSTFYQVMSMTKVPCIASHSSCRIFAPEVKRDMTDDMIRRLGENGGVMLVNFYNGFIDSIANRKQKEMEAVLKQKGLTFSDSAARPIMRKFMRERIVKMEAVVDHIDHIAKLAGVDHVGFGSDFDGVAGALPAGLENASKYPNLIAGLLKRGYSEQDIEKICGGNALRVWQAVLDAAAH